MCGPICVPELFQSLNKCDFLQNNVNNDTQNYNLLNLTSYEFNVWFITAMGIILVIVILVIVILAYCLKR